MPPVWPLPCLRRPHLKANEGQAALGFHILERKDRELVSLRARQYPLPSETTLHYSAVSLCANTAFTVMDIRMSELELEGRLVTCLSPPMPKSTATLYYYRCSSFASSSICLFRSSVTPRGSCLCSCFLQKARLPTSPSSSPYLGLQTLLPTCSVT